MIEVHQNLRHHAVEALRHIKGASRRALVRAVNRAAAAAVGEAERRIPERYSADIVDAFHDSVHITEARADRLKATIRSRGPATKLDWFPHTPKRPGTGGRGKPALRASVLRTGGAETIPGAFVIPGGGDKPIVVWRSKSGSIRRVPAIAVPFMMTQREVDASIEARALEVLDARLAHEIAHELSKGGRR